MVKKTGEASRGEQNYDPGSIEEKWQKAWEKEGFYQAKDPPAGGDKAEKFYVLIEFPYPSGAGLHVGHVRSWSAMDAYARKKRMEGFNVLYPIGWDAFGLPAENYAIKNKIHPSVAVSENIASFKRQIKSLGLSFDWNREVNTTDPKYYKWTQWIFLQFLKKGLAYQADVPVNWCPSCKTTLADEEVLPNGTHERCGAKTEKRMRKQWLLAITKYADRLLEDLKTVDYPEMVAQQQVNWIGRKEGINITYQVLGIKYQVECFTTRPDTNFGATFIVLGPEHPFVASLLSSKFNPSTKLRARVQSAKLEEIRTYVEKAKNKSEIERIAEGRKKTGVFTGFYAVNDLNGKKLPIYIGDFVLGHVGTGAVIGVPGHDIRDFEFAKAMDIPIVRVVVGPDGDTSEITKPEQVQEAAGTMVNSEFLDGLDIMAAKEKIMDHIVSKGWGEKVVSYHLRDWVFSRQHYWGEPIPVVYCANCATNKISNFKFQISNIKGKDYAIVPVPEEQLPVELPYLEQYEPATTGESPLATVSDWVNVACPNCGGKARRETDTMPNWAGSNWYYLAYLFANKLGVQSSKSTREENIFKENQEVISYWIPVDIYQGGFEHTTLHLLYSRFVYKFLFDIGVAPAPEPYAKRRSHGIVLGPDGRKMSKSFGNVINPDEIVKKFGADTLRIYEMFMGPFDQTIAWNEASVEGCFRFLKRVWHLGIIKASAEKTSAGLLQKLQKTIKKVGEDIEWMKFNTAVSAMMEFVNDWQDDKEGLSVQDAKQFFLILAPFAPHAAEELFQRIRNQELGIKEKIRQPRLTWRQPAHHNSVHDQKWPEFDASLLVEKEVTIVVQVNGKVRDVFRGQRSEVRGQKTIEQLAKESAKVQKYLEGKKIKKVVYVEGKLINFVTV
ncbi:MAG: leucine--tRNA ligase [Candidatus Levybacteria bacterium]|nr:leucine--tRNA ligase [Candidatus Levybacteria bacterium]